MLRLAWIVASALLFLDADVPQTFRFRTKPAEPIEFPSGLSLPVLPDLTQVSGVESSGGKAGALRQESRLEIIRFVSGEFAKVVRALPGGKKGFRLRAGQPVDEKILRQLVSSNGPAVNTGDTVQITRLEFHDRDILIDLNGGAKGKTRWRDRIHVEVGGGLPHPSTTTTSDNPTAAPGYSGLGATLILDFGRSLPDMSAEQLKQYLAPVLDFSKQRSAAVQWVDTLPPQIKQAIQDKRAMVGMDKEMVVAAMGRPERKVRERDPDGLETEDWIYGQPPEKTIFVRFAGEKVVSVRQYP